MTGATHHTPEEIAELVRQLAEHLQMVGRKDLLLKAIGAPLLEELRIEAARTKLSRLLITKDYRFFLMDYEQKEVELQPVHKAVYLLFLDMMDEYAASYYIISGHTQKHVAGSSRVWYERLKVITLPRELVINETEII